MFNIEDGYKLEFQKPEKMKLGNTKITDETKNGEKLPSL